MKSTIKILITLTAVLLVMAGCEYDGPTAAYDQPQPNYSNASITGMDPETAGAGVNDIKILGENFSDSLEANQVYFDNVQVDIIEATPTALKVRRPKSYGDSLTVNVVTYGSLIVATWEAYRVDQVVSTYGNFVENKQLEALTVDQDETVYVMQRSPASVHKITSDGKRTVIGQAAIIPSHVVMAPNGKLTYFKDKRIRQMDVSSGVSDTLLQVSKNAAFGDYDKYGNLYTGGGRSSDLMVVQPDLTFNVTGIYEDDDILYIRVYDNHVYLLVKIDSPDENTPELGIFKHEIQDANGTLGERETVFDWASTGDYAESEPLAFTFSAYGKLFIGSDNLDPILMIDLDNETQDIVYKGILTGIIGGMEWGTGDFLYYIKDEYEDDDGNSDEIFNLMRVDLGESGAPYYGRE
ncbi:IPT/TIG domain-containing protein [bacterium]|nr:IPT/TIG domain-containing protein [bacterium]